MLENQTQNSLIPYYDSRFKEHVSRDRVWAHISQYLETFFGDLSQSSVLELGAGYGAWIKSFNAKKKVALDLHPKIAEIFKKAGITDVETLSGSCTDLSSFVSKSFELVLASNLLEHLSIEDASLTLTEAHRILKPGGKICLIQPNFKICAKEYFDDYTHKTVFTDISLSDFLCAHGFRVVKKWPKFLPFSMSQVKVDLSFLVPFYLRSPIKPKAGQMCIIAQKESGELKSHVEQ